MLSIIVSVIFFGSAFLQVLIFFKVYKLIEQLKEKNVDHVRAGTLERRRVRGRRSGSGGLGPPAGSDVVGSGPGTRPDDRGGAVSGCVAGCRWTACATWGARRRRRLVVVVDHRRFAGDVAWRVRWAT